MAKEEPPSASRDLQELQRKLSLLIQSFQNNSKVVAFMKSPVAWYLDRHPFLALTMLIFATMSAIPVGFFLIIVVSTSLGALVGAILLEGTQVKNVNLPEQTLNASFLGYSATRREVLGLYRTIFRLARKWQAASGQMEDTIKEKQYILNEARTLFQKNKNLTDLDLIKQCIDECTARIEIGLHYQIPYPRPVHLPPMGLIPLRGRGL